MVLDLQRLVRKSHPYPINTPVDLCLVSESINGHIEMEFMDYIGDSKQTTIGARGGKHSAVRHTRTIKIMLVAEGMHVTVEISRDINEAQKFW